VCEDGSVDNYLRGITDEGEIFNFAFNIMDRLQLERGRRRDLEPGWLHPLREPPGTGHQLRGERAVGARAVWRRQRG
jgi:hypothetical protein